MSGRCGSRPVEYAATSSTGPITMSISVSAIRLDVTVVYADPGIERCAR